MESWHKPQLTPEDHVLSDGRVSDVVGNGLGMDKKYIRQKTCVDVLFSASRSIVSFSTNCSEQTLQTRATCTTKAHIY